MSRAKLLYLGRITIATLKSKQRSLTRPFHHLPLHSYSYSPTNVYSCNRTLNNLVKSGSLKSALQLFEETPMRDVVTWNILISGHGRYGFSTQALCLYDQMIFQGIIESPSTFASVLSICADAGFYSKGLQIHCRVIFLGLSENVYVGSSLVDLYLKMGLGDIALRLFNDLPERNIATWNLVMREFCELGRLDELSRLYIAMNLEGVEPNELTFCYMIKGCGSGRFLDDGKMLHCCAIKKGWSDSNLFVANALVDFYSACRVVTDARRSFEVITPEDVISWNSIVSVLANNGLLLEAVQNFYQMQLLGKRPSIRSFLGFIGLSSETENLQLGRQIHCCVVKSGFVDESVHMQSALIDMYGNCCEIESSVSIFESVPERTLGCCNSLMTAFLHCNVMDDVVEMFGLMVDEGIGFDEVSLSTTLKAVSLSSFASFCSCSLLHCCATKSGFEYDFTVSSVLIDAYSRFGHVKLSCKVFEKITFPNVVCFTSIISAYARNGMGIEGLKMLETMMGEGLKPDKVTFLCMLMGCNHSGLVKEGRLVFYSMKTLHGIHPERQHYSCMIDLLGRAGLLYEAEELLRKAPSKDDSVMWSSLLRSCRVHGNEKIGRRVAKILMDLEPEDPAAWMQASNFYSEIGEFETSMQIKEIAMARKMQRDIGYSLIEVKA